MPYDLFPSIEPRRTGYLPVDDIHRIWWEECGNPDGLPVVFLHGGPGSGCSPDHRRFFDPKVWRIVLLDQRGAGRSTPFAETDRNTTQNLVADLEAIREHLGIEKWMVFGGSWGSTLALSYGISHPDRCTGFVLRGIFLGRAAEIDWFLHGMGTFFPEAHRRYLEFLPAAERADPLTAYHTRLTDPDPRVHEPAAREWTLYESACSTLVPALRPGMDYASSSVTLAVSRLEAHYFVNSIFHEDDALIDGVSRLLKDHPATIVQGRYDVVCPIRSADDLARAWPSAEYIVVPDAGHSAMEPGIRSALVNAVARMADGLRS